MFKSPGLSAWTKSTRLAVLDLSSYSAMDREYPEFREGQGERILKTGKQIFLRKLGSANSNHNDRLTVKQWAASSPSFAQELPIFCIACVPIIARLQASRALWST